MKNLEILLLLVLVTISKGYAQHKTLITTMDFVEILNENREEAIYYYQNNWKVLRQMATERNYIHSFEVLETPFAEEARFELVLITTYRNEEQYASREEHFRELIKEKGSLQLLNDKKPNQFRKTLFNKETVRHWE